ncbi:MAG: exosortase/archaeosortase family protein [Acidobacteria bacterium]|nr:exosortase/archaeosortase family protein [Acidobacteriota bacterium]
MESTLEVTPEQLQPNAGLGTRWIKQAVWFAVLLGICYAPIGQRLIQQWMNDEDMGHGFFVPVIAVYIAWQKRDELAATVLKPSNLGLLLILLGAVQALVGTLGAELFISRTAIIVSIVGCVLFLGGIPALKVLGFPLFLLCFMVPIPSIIYNQITFPLQLLASRVAEVVLGGVGIPVVRDGNILELPSQKLSVVEACSGIRSLLSLTFLSLVYGFFFDRKPWMKWALFVATVPIAIAANASRVTMTGVLSEINPELARGAYHTAEGWIVYVVDLAILVGVHAGINWIYNRRKGAKTANV